MHAKEDTVKQRERQTERQIERERETHTHTHTKTGRLASKRKNVALKAGSRSLAHLKLKCLQAGTYADAVVSRKYLSVIVSHKS